MTDGTAELSEPGRAMARPGSDDLPGGGARGGEPLGGGGPGAAAPFRVVVVGNGMVGSRFAADLLATAGPDQEHRARPLRVTVLGDEEYDPYNRVLLSEVVAGRADIGALTLPSTGDERAEVHRGAPAIAIDRSSRTVLTSDGAFPYDAVVLATGSSARVPDVPGLGSGPGGTLPAGVHALRTLDDAREIVAATSNARRAVVIGAGVLGLEVACGLARRGLAVTVVHGGASPMDRQLGPDAGLAASRTLAELGIAVRTGVRTREVVVRGAGGRGAVVAGVVLVPDAGRSPRAAGVPGAGGTGGEGRGTTGTVPDRGPGDLAAAGRPATGPTGPADEVPTDLLVLACGTVPEGTLARTAGLTVDRGVVVGHGLASPDDPDVYAIGDCAQPPEGGTGLIAQGWEQSRRLAALLALRVLSEPRRALPRPGSDTSGAAARLHVRFTDDERPSMALRIALGVEQGGRSPGDEQLEMRPTGVSSLPAPPSAASRGEGVMTGASSALPADSPAALSVDPPVGSAVAPARTPPAAPTDVVRLKAAGLDVVAMGVCGARRAHDPSHRTLRLTDPDAGRHVEVVVAGGFLVGATVVGAPQIGADLTATYTRRVPVPADPAHLLLQPVAQAAAPASDPTHMPDRTTVCSCNGVTKGDIVASWREGARSTTDIARATRATTGCGGCKDVVCGLADWLRKADPEQPGTASATPPAGGRAPEPVPVHG
ncbi:FAD-dependent oxidoreductase [Oerskovia enterophila]|uniref:Nitrite reductase n=1 Tax=Oerskovia enterophila TaxID=43678 RepID=A0ABX2Y6R0_9CELL|nr:FAD-dependent oxidoreductase [Oerskovia enterophila]OCI32260.1 nitrite reductase [Oerskovia enterophila]